MKITYSLLLLCLAFVVASDFVDTVQDVGVVTPLSSHPFAKNHNESSNDRLYEKLKFLPWCKKSVDDRNNEEYAKCFGLTFGIIAILGVLVIGIFIFVCVRCYKKRIPKSNSKIFKNTADVDEEKQPLLEEKRDAISHKQKRYCEEVMKCFKCLFSIDVKTEYELRREERLTQEASDKNTALGKSEKIFPDYKFHKLEDLGSRLQKYWYFRRNKNATGPDMLQMTMKQSTVCRIDLEKKEVAVIKGLMKCLQSSCLLKVEDMEVQDGSIIVLVEFVREGSLRDQIHMANPCDDWATKYCENGRTIVFSDNEISTCGENILKAMLYLYEQGFPIIGQIHSGNVFKIGDRYVLGGYENTILGYRTSLYSKFCEENLLDHMDEIMLGLLLYEMATGNYHQALLDNLNFHELCGPNITEILNFLCSTGLRKIGTKEERAKKILKQPFFEKTRSDEIKPFHEYSPEGLRLLQHISSPSTKKFSVKDSCPDITLVLNTLKEKYTLDSGTCPNIGWRNEKVWAKVGETILSAITVPYTCPIFVKTDMDSIRTIAKVQCDFLLEVHDIHYVKVNDNHVVVLVKKFVPTGSLKDQIHCQQNPLQPWEEKYSTTQLHLFTLKEIAIIGSQVLNIIRELRYIHGDPTNPLALTFIHSGNIFWDGKQCRLDGIENMLLGCRPRDYLKYKDHLHHIDRCMLGNLIFELATGQELAGALPTKSEYDSVHRTLKNVLKQIFDDEISLEDISRGKLFKNHSNEKAKLKFKGDVKLCLERVKKGKWRDQDDELAKSKYKLQKPIRKLRNAIPGGRRSTTPTVTSMSAESAC